MEDVLAFLDKHLPKRTPLTPEEAKKAGLDPQEHETRGWRIIMADDHSPHLHKLVKDLCWKRGYIFIAHGGGVTPFVQTVDTDLNQPAKRRYISQETAELLELMRQGKVVPQLKRPRCVEIMTSVMSDMGLHLHAADGYLKTGLRLPLDDSTMDDGGLPRSQILLGQVGDAEPHRPGSGVCPR